jgi:exodeoxyribonuclease VII large subunit
VYWVVGELADFRQAPQGHVYFELVEKQGNQLMAKIRANLWQYTFRSVAAKFESVTGTSLKNGMKVLAFVSVNFHPVFGLSVNVKDIDPSFSLGERARIRQETIDRLTGEGLIRLNSQQILPPVIQRIAVISSSTAAGYGDFVNQVGNNPYGYRIQQKLYNSLMQGNEAVVSLLSALDRIKEDLETFSWDAVVIIRGGGAQLDLDCFDDYRLGAKIAAFPIPVFTGIGHERDETIADLVAHTRLKTPTAVAEFILDSFREFEENLGTLTRRLDRATRIHLKEEENKLQNYFAKIKSNCAYRFSMENTRINTISKNCQQAFRNLVKQQTSILDQAEKNIAKGAARYLKVQQNKIEHLELILKQLDPVAILKRGYTRTEINGKPVHLQSVKIGDLLITHTGDKKLGSTLTKIENK